MPKKRTFSNRVGTIGENAFRAFCERRFLLPTKIEEDVGTDFICQIDLAKSIKQTGVVSGSIIGACVRASTKQNGRIQLTRQDAENLLAARYPVMVALVHVEGDDRKTFFRFIDEELADRLFIFLGGNNKQTSLTISDCHPESEFTEMLSKVTEGNFVEQVRLSLSQGRLEKILSGPQLEIRRNSQGELAIITADRFFEFFKHDVIPSKDEVLTRLRELFAGHPGNLGVALYFVIPNESEVIVSTQAVKVAPNDVLVGAVNRLFGAGVAEFT